MPELPEAETIVAGLGPAVTGAEVTGVEILHDDVIAGDGEAFARRVRGRTIEAAGRRGKNIVLRLDGGPRIVVNLGMSGRLLHRAAATAGDASPEPTHPAVVWRLGGGGRLVYHDVRRFGRLAVLDPDGYREWSARLGPEPLGRRFTARFLRDALARSRSPVRQWLLDQRRLAGVGNIYANEALHRAGIHPATPASAVPSSAVPGLHRAIRRVLREAIDASGTTLRDYRTAEGEEGSYGGRLRVYGRAGDACTRCGTPIERLVLSNRSSFFCPRCQPAADDADVTERVDPAR